MAGVESLVRQMMHSTATAKKSMPIRACHTDTTWTRQALAGDDDGLLHRRPAESEEYTSLAAPPDVPCCVLKDPKTRTVLKDQIQTLEIHHIVREPSPERGLENEFVYFLW